MVGLDNLGERREMENRKYYTDGESKKSTAGIFLIKGPNGILLRIQRFTPPAGPLYF